MVQDHPAPDVGQGRLDLRPCAKEADAADHAGVGADAGVRDGVWHYVGDQRVPIENR